MKNKILESMNRTQAQRDRDQLVSKFTDGLLLQTQIDSHGTAPICWMTEKPARAHREAMKVWVLEQLQSLDLQLDPELIHPLRHQLNFLFARIQEAD